MKRYLFGLFSASALIGLDQWTKALAVSHLKGKPSIALISDVFVLTYIENKGMAFGIFENQRWIFLILTTFIIAVLLYAYVKIPRNRYFLPLVVLDIFLLSGAIGNMIDRIRMGYVVDFFYFMPINFPVFNVADIYVTVSAFICGILYLFYYKEGDFKFLLLQKPK